jgi:tRNA(Arg) A34 adenosine deaminase TadA
MNNKFMEHAIKLSIESVKKGTGPFGACVVKDNTIISEGFNTVTSAPFDVTSHAEISAIRKACKKLNNFSLAGCELYTSSECCSMCLSACYWSRIDKVYYVNTREDAKAINFDDSHIYEELQKNINERKIPMIQIKTMKEQAIKAFEMWSKSGNTKY